MSTDYRQSKDDSSDVQQVAYLLYHVISSGIIVSLEESLHYAIWGLTLHVAWNIAILMTVKFLYKLKFKE